MKQSRLNLISLMPATLFVPFNAYRASAATVTWSNASISPVVDLADASYFIPLEGDPAGCVLSASKEFLAERYGGMGLGKNGGGVRCGYDGTVQIKGIGQNPLVGDDRNFFHSYGGAALSEAVLDALWGEVCNIVLPYGAARVHGILETGTQVPIKFPKSGKSTMTRRALIVREAVLRPAHFMRAIYFSGSAFPFAAASDAKRVADAINEFGPALGITLGLPDQCRDTPEDEFQRINSCLHEMYRRFACQIAAARANRMMHGSLTPSNVAVTGQWLDFSSMSAVSDYGRVIIPRGAPDFMNEEQMLRPALDDLVFYLNKYSGLKNHHLYFNADEIWGWFQDSFASRLHVEFLMLSGIPEEDLRGLDSEVKNRFYRVLCTIMQAGNEHPFKILVDDNDYVPSMPEKMGTYHLPTIMTKAAYAGSGPELMEELAHHLADISLRQEFADAYLKLRNAFLDRFSGHNRSSAQLFLALNCIRRNALCRPLYRTVLYPEMDEVIENGADVGEFIHERVALARLLHSPVKHRSFDATLWFGLPATVHVSRGISLNGIPVDSVTATKRLDERVFGAELKIKVIGYVS